jgi:hypothetical protein
MGGATVVRRDRNILKPCGGEAMTSSGNDTLFDGLVPSRREVVLGGAAVAISTVLLPIDRGLAAEAGGMVSGVVYENRSGGVRRQAGDPGISGVLVSNGREVAKTDADGRYTLPIEDESIVFVIKPTGYAVPVDEEMLPRFYYIHRHAAKPQPAFSWACTDRTAPGFDRLPVEEGR